MTSPFVRQAFGAAIRRSGVAVAAAALLLAATAADAQIPGPAATSQERAIAFVDVNVIPMDRERVLQGHTVVVRNGRITAMGPTATTSVPAGALRIDASGQFLMPGIAEMHAHVPGQNRAEMERVLFLFLANGITVARGMLGSPAHLELREQLRQGQLAGPRLYTSGPSFSGGNQPASREEAAQRVAAQKAAGYDLLKIHPGLSREIYDAIAEAAHREGIPFAGHVPADVGLRRALEAGQITVDHLDLYIEEILRDDAPTGVPGGWFGFNLIPYVDESKIREIARATREAGVWNAPTQTLMEHLMGPEPPEQIAARPEMQYMPPQAVQSWVENKRRRQAADDYSVQQANRYVQVRRQIIKALHDAGAGIILASDAPQIFNVPGFVIHDELRMYVEAGLTPFEALQTGTVNVARYLGKESEFGTVATGRWADLVLLDANPLADIGNTRNPAGVMVDGRWFPRDVLHQGLETIAASRRTAEEERP